MKLDPASQRTDAAAMLEGIDTGYEAKFDFPAWQGTPQVPWLLASVPRSGSTFVSHLLWASGCLGAPLEYLNFEPAGPYGHASGDPAAQQRIWREMLARRTSQNGVFGLKAFPLMLEQVQQTNPALLSEVMRLLLPGRGSARVVQLRRRDRTAHAVSYARALLSGIWRKEQERAGEDGPEFSRRAFEHALRLIDGQEGAWQDMYVGLGIEPLVIWYEDCLTEPDKTVADVAKFLGVTLDAAARAEVPQIERQSQRGTGQWFAALDGSSA